MKDVIVIGGGAAGMMAAISAAENGNRVSIYEKNEKLGKKLFITGKGRCNVTNSCDTEELFQNVISNPKFLYSAFYGFDNKQVCELIERAGCKLKNERGNRVFPVSDHSSDVIRALQDILKEKGVEVHLKTSVKEVTIQKANVESIKKDENLKTDDSLDKDRVTGIRLQNGTIVSADAVIVATGGVSYQSTGSTGDGYDFAKQAGHEIITPRPALVPLKVAEPFCKELMGLSLKNVKVTLTCKGRELYNDFGEMLFTHYGVSGPLILSASSFYTKKAFGQKAELTIDLKPALTEEQLDKRLLRDFEENRNKQFKNALNGLLPIRLIPIIISLSGILPEKKTGDITKEERKHFIELLKNFPLTITGCSGFEEAIITQGGVSVQKVNPSTMESKLVQGLYFAGEVLDLDALTGGFNLQIAWSTGHLAGENI